MRGANMCNPGPASSSRYSRGFTLLEVLVVVTIIGIVAGMVTLRIGDHGREVRHERESRRLQQTIDLAMQEAIVRGRQYGLAVSSGDYRFCRREGDGWRELSDDRHLAPHVLPENLRMEIQSRLPRRESPAGDADEECPLVRFFPSGEAEPLQVAMIDAVNETSMAIHITATGRVRRILR